MSSPAPLCLVTDIPDGEAKGFEADGQRILIARKGLQVFGWLNVCPHMGINLEWAPDQFMSSDGEYLQCAMHGALFRVDDGFCVFGPCSGDSLQRVPLEVENGRVFYAG